MGREVRPLPVLMAVPGSVAMVVPGAGALMVPMALPVRWMVLRVVMVVPVVMVVWVGCRPMGLGRCRVMGAMVVPVVPGVQELSGAVGVAGGAGSGVLLGRWGPLMVVLVAGVLMVVSVSAVVMVVPG
ncbi:hypothetical protein MHIB_29940 [Mycolicibacter hiberniae]|uniref:Uncharacterized protein n=1 Tax=Mycolicibacter hiberniae TaxID=29314 RepID=A0A7I7X4J2_9MYCO|nr:hypothetical protein [Mycolicibacter hiberniae]BBZ24576.1 hypothetical protein MHIB_29940 [Mycolicibacter hiberniae]